jgi:hypothetical protein
MKLRPKLSDEQEYRAHRWAALEVIAKKAGFDDDALVATEFCLMDFFDAIVEHCAVVAEQQGRNYSGENNEMAGCSASANAVRTYGKKFGNE